MKRRSGTIASVVIGGFVIIFVILLVSPNGSRATSDLSPNSPRTSDAYDPNDNFYAATYISDGFTTNLGVSSSDTADYFYVIMSSRYELTVNIDWSAYADVDLFLYDSNYNQIDSSVSGLGYYYEDVSFTVQTAGQYFILVEYLSGTGTITYSMNVDTSNYVNQFSPWIFLSIFIPIVIVVSIVIIVAVAVHQYNKKQRVIHPSTVRPPPPILQGPQPTLYYAPQPSSFTPSYAPSYAPSSTPTISQQPAVNVAPPKPESKGRFCIGCGVKIESTQRFCHNCGIDNETK